MKVPTTVNEGNLILAYYVATQNYNGLGVEEKELSEIVVKTTIRKFRKEVNEFRDILLKLVDETKVSQEKLKIVKYLKNVTITNLRKITKALIDSSRVELDEVEKNGINKLVDQNRIKLNKEEVQRYDDKLRSLGKYRNLRKL